MKVNTKDIDSLFEKGFLGIILILKKKTLSDKFVTHTHTHTHTHTQHTHTHTPFYQKQFYITFVQ